MCACLCVSTIIQNAKRVISSNPLEIILESMSLSLKGSHDMMAHRESSEPGIGSTSNPAVALTAYSCMTSNVLKHASFSSTFSELQENPARSSARVRARGPRVWRRDKTRSTVKKQQEEDAPGDL